MLPLSLHLPMFRSNVAPSIMESRSTKYNLELLYYDRFVVVTVLTKLDLIYRGAFFILRKFDL
jgi:hypothetical protein